LRVGKRLRLRVCEQCRKRVPLRSCERLGDRLLCVRCAAEVAERFEWLLRIGKVKIG